MEKEINVKGIFPDGFVKYTPEQKLPESLNFDDIEKIVLDELKETTTPTQQLNDVQEEDLFSDFPEPIKNEVQESFESITTEAEEEAFTLNDLIMEKIKLLTTSEVYPVGYPSFEELLELKKQNQQLLVITSGNLFEEFHWDLKPEIFICTTLKNADYLEYMRDYKDEKDLTLFFPFVLERCCLFPRITGEAIMQLPAGIVKKLTDNILINSRFKTTVEVLKL